MSPSEDGVQAMRRIAREKTGQPEGKVAQRKLQKVASDQGFNIHIYADLARFTQAVNEAWRQMRKVQGFTEE